MKPLLIGGPIALALIFAGSACKRPASTASFTPPRAPVSIASVAAAKTLTVANEVEAKVRPEEHSKMLKEAEALFHKRDIAGALTMLDDAPAALKIDPGFLNLRGACHVEKKDFKAALADFEEATKKDPDNPGVQFNIAEMYYVTKRWDEAVKAFQLVKSKPGGVPANLSALVDFKLMLCEEGRGNAAEFERLANANLKEADTLLAAYTKAAMEFRAGKKADAKVTIAAANKKFPDRSETSPYYDTMIEFGYDPRK